MTEKAKDNVEVTFKGLLYNWAYIKLDDKQYRTYLNKKSQPGFDITQEFETFLFIPIITPGEVSMRIDVNGQTIVESKDVRKLECESQEIIDDDSGHPSGAKRHKSGFTFGNSANLACADESLLKIRGGHVLCIDEQFIGSIIFNFTTKKFDISKLELTSGVSTFGKDGDYDPEIFCYAVYYDGKISSFTNDKVEVKALDVYEMKPAPDGAYLIQDL